MAGLLAEMAMGVMTRRLYGPDHPRGAEAGNRGASLVEPLAAALKTDSITLLEVEDELFVEAIPTGGISAQAQAVVESMRRAGVERMTLGSDVRPAEIERLIEFLASSGAADLSDLSGVRVGRVTVAGREAGGGEDDLRRPPEVLTRNRVGLLRDILEGLAVGEEIELRPLRDIVAELAALIERGTPLRELLADVERVEEWLAVHGQNTAALTLVVAAGLRLDSAVRTDLGLAALVHDVGKVGAERSDLARELELNGDQLEDFPDHPKDGLELLLGVAGLPAVVPVVAFEHHRDPEGQGWPVTRQRRRPHPAAQIVAAAETLDILHTVRGRRGRATRESIVAMLRNRAGQSLEPRLASMAELVIEEL